jgi:hypothetical protein
MATAEQMTPLDLAWQYDGWRWREERADDRTAWLLVGIMNSQGTLRRAMTVRDVLGRDLGESRVRSYQGR